MSNGKPFVTLNLDKPRKLRFGFKALIMLEDLMGVTSLDQLQGRQMSMKDIVTFLYAGLCSDDKDLTQESLLDIIDEYGDVGEIGDALEEAIKQAYGQEMGNAQPQVKKPKK